MTELPYLDRLKVPPTPERQLLIWIDDLFDQSVPGMVWEGTAEQLRNLLGDAGYGTRQTITGGLNHATQSTTQASPVSG
jgi:hypothetical protein